MDPAMTLASGQGLSTAVVGYQNFFQLQLRDSDGDPVLGPDAFNISAGLENQPNLLFNSAYLESGRYLLSYTPYLLGGTLLRVYVDAVEISQSPFSLVVVQGALAPEHTVVSGGGLYNATAGTPALIQVSLRDQHNNTIDTAAAIRLDIQQTFCAQCSPTQILSLPSLRVPLGAGYYQYSYVPQLVVPTTVQLRVNGVFIPLPSQQVAVSAGLAAAAASNAYGNGINHPIMNRNNVFFIQARDSLSNPVSLTDLLFVVDIYHSNVTYPATVVPQGDGLYKVTYQPTEPGDFVIEIALQDDTGTLLMISGSPFKTRASGALSHLDSLTVAALGGSLLLTTFAGFAIAIILLFRRFNETTKPSPINQGYECIVDPQVLDT